MVSPSTIRVTSTVGPVSAATGCGFGLWVGFTVGLGVGLDWGVLVWWVCGVGLLAAGVACWVASAWGALLVSPQAVASTGEAERSAP